MRLKGHRAKIRRYGCGNGSSVDFPQRIRGLLGLAVANLTRGAPLSVLRFMRRRPLALATELADEFDGIPSRSVAVRFIDAAAPAGRPSGRDGDARGGEGGSLNAPNPDAGEASGLGNNHRG
jgi:hypothetical protein